MALSSSSGFGNSGPLLFLTPRTKNADGDKVAPHFTVDRKGPDGKFIRDTETVNKVTGDLFKVECKKGEYEGEPTWEGVYYLRDSDANESYRVGIRFGIPGRGLINTLYSLVAGGDFSRLTIDYYQNKAGYDAFGVKQGDNRDNLRWAVALDDQPKAEPIMHKGKLVKNDYTEINEFWATKLEEIAAVVNKAPAAKNESAAPAQTPAAKPVSAPAAKQAAAAPAATSTKTAAKKTTTRAPAKAASTTVAETEGAQVGTSDVPAGADPF